MDSFNQRKKSVLEKEDKAAKGSWDKRIVKLCDKLNSRGEYYTTSSCSGKSVIMEEKTGKDGSYYLWTSHELISLEELSGEVVKVILEGVIKFKSESPIIFVVSNTIENARELMKKAVNSGFKESGIKITDKLIGLEIRSGEKLEFPLIKGGENLVSKDFLSEVVNQANFRRELGWKKIERLILDLS